jgi:hypothetical protein
MNAITQMLQQNEVAANVTKEDAAAKAAIKRTRRPAQKQVEKKESIVTKSALVLAVKYELTSARPVAGRKLNAFTESVLQLLGMYKGKRYSRNVLAKIMGDTAVNYHTRKTGAFDVTEQGIGLNGDFGIEFFKMRTENKEYDANDLAVFKEILTTGKIDGNLVKNATFIRPLSF